MNFSLASIVNRLQKVGRQSISIGYNRPYAVIDMYKLYCSILTICLSASPDPTLPELLSFGAVSYRLQFLSSDRYTQYYAY